MRPLLGVVLLLLTSAAAAVDWQLRLKAVGSAAVADDNDIVARLGEDPATGLTLDARLMASGGGGHLRWDLAWELVSVHGDVVVNSGLLGGPGTGEAAVPDDRRRAVDLTATLSDGPRHATVHRLDRALLTWQGDAVQVSLGRQALSLGNGLVFNPVDLFNPFGPTVTDRDYKPGDDLMRVAWLTDGGSEVEVFGVLRRDGGGLSGDAGSWALRWRRGFAMGLEVDALAALHVDEPTVAFGLSGPVAGALWRVNWLLADTRDNGVRHALVANIDRAFTLGGRSAYAFVEAYHNGFGDRRAPDDPSRLDRAAVERLGRGELFVLGRHYLAVGGNVELHPLWQLSGLVLGHLGDGSTLWQANLDWNPATDVTVQAGVLAPLGGAGDEFGGVRVAPGVLAGTSRQAYMRLVWYP